MFKFLACALRAADIKKSTAATPKIFNYLQCNGFSNTTNPLYLQLKPIISPVTSKLVAGIPSRSGGILLAAQRCVQEQQVRSVTKFSIRKGKRKSVKSALSRFFRLAWGGWIRTRASRYKRLWTKTEDQKRRYRQHIFCNATQSTMLDKMVTSYWKKRRYYVDDPYEPYHSREEFAYTAVKPLPLSYHLENNPKLNPKKENEVLSYFKKKYVDPDLKYKVK